MRRKKLRIVCIGGGTGLSTLLRGLRQYVQRHGTESIDMDALTAIVAVSDDGGSSGRLIDEFQVLPPGDIRNCLVALADEEEMLARLFEYRFQSNGPLRGHSVGNLLLVALSDMFGSFPAAIREASRVLAVRGRILPVTLEPTVLCAELKDGSVVRGESAIPERENPSPIQRVFLERRVPAGEHPGNPIPGLPEAVKAIEEADAVIIGPGSLFTSILPNIAVADIAQALQRTPAVTLYVCNVMVEPGETDGFSVRDHVEALLRHGRFHLDYVLVNSKRASETLIQQYHLAELIQQVRWLRAEKEDPHARRTLADLLELHPWLSELDLDQPISYTELVEQLEPDQLRALPEVDGARIQVLYQPNVDRDIPARVVQEPLLCEEVIRERNETLRVLRHEPLKLAEAIVRLLANHYGTAPR